MAHFGEDLRGMRFAVWGLAFKPRTDDMREAPAVTVIEALLAAGAEVHAHDPEALERGARASSATASTTTASTTTRCSGADALLIVTEWNEFRRPDFERMKQLMKPAGHLRRPQHLRAGRRCASSASPTIVGRRRPASRCSDATTR